MAYQSLSTAPSLPPTTAQEHARQPDMIRAYGGNVFSFLDIVTRKLGRCFEELTDDDCTIILCGFLCQPCLIAQVLEDVGENWWLTCCTVTLAPNLLGLPYLCFTVPALNRLNQRLGGGPISVQNFLCLCFCRPCLACQLARAVRQAKLEGRLGGHAPDFTARANPSAPREQQMERF